ncbi:MAG: ribose-5-phosphate isomerase RpiA [SAR324 cluster bacterium]|nr:ribose-5-phosphate isomerase RpiA [SAR324 cluster bacterium]
MEQEKKVAGEAAVDYVESGMVVGLGTGSTAYYAILELGRRVRDGIKIQAIPTSEHTRKLAESENIPMIDFSKTIKIDLTIDGADEVDPQLNMIKGGGGALLREKIIASASTEMIVIADSSKNVPCLGQFPLPVEVTPFGWQTVVPQIEALGARAVLREKNGETFVTDNHMYILDCHFGEINDPVVMEVEINDIPGVVINGLFVGLATRLLVGQGSSVKTIERE